VTWSGFFIEKGVKHKDFSFRDNDAINLLIKMEPSETDSDPDIVLSMTNADFQKNKNIIDVLKRGDKVQFTAKFVSIGNEFTPHHLYVFKIVATGENKLLNDIKVTDLILPASISSDISENPSQIGG